jgi:para-nitrobenzyl esterase
MDVAEPVVRTDAGQVRGRTEGGIAVFRGIPFAQPPVGDLRFAAPRPARLWDGVREAAMFGPPPPQSGFMLAPTEPVAPGADPDDWLTVNVFSPGLGAAGLPVMVWIYGGAYRFGASCHTGYDGAPLARRGVVVVTFNHRVGVEGYAYLPGVPANRALLDQVAALRWVRENIAAFGGDPERVTVFGESAGAGAIASLLVMPAAAGLFRRAIAQSVPGTFFAPDLAADVTAAIAAVAGLPPTAEAFAAAEPARLVAASDAVRPADYRDRWGPVGGTGVPFSPVVDGEVLPAARAGRSGRRGRLPRGLPGRRRRGAVRTGLFGLAVPDADPAPGSGARRRRRRPDLPLPGQLRSGGGRARCLSRDRRAAGVRRLARARADAVRRGAAAGRGGPQ